MQEATGQGYHIYFRTDISDPGVFKYSWIPNTNFVETLTMISSLWTTQKSSRTFHQNELSTVMRWVACQSPRTQLMKLSSAWAVSGSSILCFVVSMWRVRAKGACCILSAEQWFTQPEQACQSRLPGRSREIQARVNHHEKARPGNVNGMGSLVPDVALTGQLWPWEGHVISLNLIRKITRLD